MDFKAQMCFRLISLVGLTLLAVGTRVGQDWAILIGIPLWVFLMPWCCYGFGRRSLDFAASIWRTMRSRKERVTPGSRA